MWITLWIDVDKSWISCDSHAIQLNFSCIILCPLGVSRPLCTQNSQNQHLSSDSVGKSADTIRFLLLCTRLCTMFDISRRACQRSPLTNPVDERGADYVFGLFSCAAFASGIVVSFGTVPENTVSCASLVT